jgi:arylsulfatase A-like enzyme
LVDGSATDWPREIFVQVSESQVGRAIRTARWKYGVTAPDKKGGGDPASDRYVEQYLYDLDADPYERTNLVSDPKLTDVRRRLAATLKRRMVAAGEEEPAIEPAP